MGQNYMDWAFLPGTTPQSPLGDDMLYHFLLDELNYHYFMVPYNYAP
jgi:hypothetical protein